MPVYIAIFAEVEETGLHPLNLISFYGDSRRLQVSRIQALELFSKNDSWVELASKRNSEALASPVVPFANEAALYIFENIHGMSLSLTQRMLFIAYL